MEKVGRDDNFFTLGGHSLNAIQMIARVRSLLGVRLPLSVLYRNSTLTSLAECVTAAQSAETEDSAPGTMEFDDLLICPGPAQHLPEQ